MKLTLIAVTLCFSLCGPLAYGAESFSHANCIPSGHGCLNGTTCHHCCNGVNGNTCAGFSCTCK